MKKKSYRKELGSSPVALLLSKLVRRRKEKRDIKKIRLRMQLTPHEGRYRTVLWKEVAALLLKLSQSLDREVQMKLKRSVTTSFSKPSPSPSKKSPRTLVKK